jgi:hypothetical protein
MPNIPDESVDMILADLPLVQQSKMGFSNWYGKTMGSIWKLLKQMVL